MEPAEGMQWQFGQASQWPASAASSAKYLSRATALEHPLLGNSERPSMRASYAMPVNSAVELFPAAYAEPGLTVTTVKWANRLAAAGDPWPLFLLANAGLPSIASGIDPPINDAVEPRNRG